MAMFGQDGGKRDYRIFFLLQKTINLVETYNLGSYIKSLS